MRFIRVSSLCESVLAQSVARVIIPIDKLPRKGAKCCYNVNIKGRGEDKKAASIQEPFASPRTNGPVVQLVRTPDC